MIVGTAGHIDHGKTTLVRALTGVDTDRLKEEKARGISIELGYAYVPFGANACDVLGFVDVPGHERLVHTMVAGVGGIDFALLVVAADDGVMPQTREHVAILDLLGVTRAAVALTKIDRVGPARMATVRADVAALLAPTPLRDAPVFALDATAPADDGVAALRAHLEAVARTLPPRAQDGLFRLAVDRVFTLAGHGTVVTGTVHAGCVRIGDVLRVWPRDLPARVRGLHAQNRPDVQGVAGQRCAINLAGVERDAIARGDWIADARAFAPSPRLDVALRRLDGAAPLIDGASVHVHLGTAHAVARVVTLDAAPAAAYRQRVQLVFEAPVCAQAGDRFILRDARATRTLGGGRVLDPQAPARRRRSAERHAWLDAIETMLDGAGPAALLPHAPFGLDDAVLARLTGIAPGGWSPPAGTRVLASAAGRLMLAAARWDALRARLLDALAAFHMQAPDEPGVDAGRLRRIAMPTAPEPVWRALVDAGLDDGCIERSGPWLRLPGHRVQFGEREQALAERLLRLLVDGRFDPPWVRDLAVMLGLGEDEVRATLRRCAALGLAHQVVRDLFYAPSRIDELAAIVRAVAAHDGVADVARCRDAFGLGRKRSVQILEYFDRVGYTRRARDGHVLRADSGWRDAAG